MMDSLINFIKNSEFYVKPSDQGKFYSSLFQGDVAYLEISDDEESRSENSWSKEVEFHSNVKSLEDSLNIKNKHPNC